MNYRALVSPLLYGGSAAAVVSASGYALAVSQSVSIYIPTIVFIFGGFSAFGLLAGASSMNEHSEDVESHGGQDGFMSAPTEAGTPRRLLLVCFSLGLAVAGMVGVTLLG